MQSAVTVLGVLRERGRRGLPCDELYRQLFNPQLYLLAYGRIYSNQGAMTPGVTQETVDGMSQARIGRIIDAMRHERYRFRPVRRVHIPKKNGKTRPLGLPTWSDKLAGGCGDVWSAFPAAIRTIRDIGGCGTADTQMTICSGSPDRRPKPRRSNSGWRRSCMTTSSWNCPQARR